MKSAKLKIKKKTSLGESHAESWNHRKSGLIYSMLSSSKFWVYLGGRTCELFLCFVPFVLLVSIMLTVLFLLLFSLFYVTHDFYRMSPNPIRSRYQSLPSDLQLCSCYVSFLFLELTMARFEETFCP